MADIVGAENLTLRLYKRAVGNPAYTWVNTYEFTGCALPTASAGSNLIEDCVEAERMIHRTTVEYTKGVLSTWVNDSDIYDPQSFIVQEIALLNGTKAPFGEDLPRNVVLHVKRAVATGRSGRMFFRGCLGEEELDGNNTLIARLTGAAEAALVPIVDTMYDAFQDALTLRAGATAKMALISGGYFDWVARPVTGFAVRGVSFLDDDFKYWDIGT